MSTNSRPKRNPRRAVKDRWEEQKLMTSAESQLIDLDLVKLLAKPESWNLLDEEEKKEIVSLLPDNIKAQLEPSPDDPDAKMPPIPESFLRYSNPWRDSIRQFQLDLQNGRYDPKWLQQADEAMRERSAGKFDNFKEIEFEEFWGQKQKMDTTIAAGESSQVKLETLIENGLVRPGDVWKLSRAFTMGKGRRERVFIEKEGKILEINGSRLTFLVPPGQRVFLSHPQSKAAPESTSINESSVGEETLAKPEASDTIETPAQPHLDTDQKEKAASSKKRKSSNARGGPRKQQQVTEQGENGSGKPIPSPENNEQTLGSSENPQKFAVKINNPQQTIESQTHLVVMGSMAAPAEEAKNGDQIPTDTIETVSGTAKKGHSQLNSPAGSTKQFEEIILENINGPHSLEMKMIAIDGRIGHIPNGNAWKEFRCYRNNQDMGSLWEIRQAWFIRNCAK
ncbi:hypothetical protein AWENTII_000412 [Aspergillus wentii]